MSPGTGLQYWGGDITLSPAAARLHDPKRVLDPYAGNPCDLTVFVSCYNESDYITDTLTTVCSALRKTRGGALSYEIIVIDDCSRDDSAEIVRNFIAAHPQEPIMLRINTKNKGWAQNYLDAAFLGCGKYFRPICGDNSEQEQTMIAVFGAIGEADIIVPFYGKFEDRNRDRVLISKAFTVVVNLISGHRLRYYNGLAVHLRHNVMRWHPDTHGFGFQADILCRLLDLGFFYKEVEVSTVENRKGKSNALTVRNVLSVLHTVLEIFLRRVANRIYRQ